jgi:hypothetical protein
MRAPGALRAIARNACSTPLFSFADVPNSAAPMEAAYVSDSSSDTCLLRSMSTLFPASTSAMSLPASAQTREGRRYFSSLAWTKEPVCGMHACHTSHLAQLLDPALHSVEAINVRDVKNQQRRCAG